MTNNEILNALEAWGVNLEETLSRFIDDSELYIECLYTFADDNNFVDLGVALQNADYQRAFDCAHTLKGVAGNLGLTPLFNVLSDLVEPLRANIYDNLLKLYENVMAIQEQVKGILGLAVHS